jgi:hypothetical protein
VWEALGPGTKEAAWAVRWCSSLADDLDFDSDADAMFELARTAFDAEPVPQTPEAIEAFACLASARSGAGGPLQEDLDPGDPMAAAPGATEGGPEAGLARLRNVTLALEEAGDPEGARSTFARISAAAGARAGAVQERRGAGAPDADGESRGAGDGESPAVKVDGAEGDGGEYGDG